MGSRAPKVTDQNDREIPDEYVGKLDPGYYCRAWNAKRQKYCKARAGSKTEHSGVGRCRRHDAGADGKVVHGQNRRYANLATNRVRELIEEHANDPNPLDLLPDLHAARAMLQDFIERTAEDEHPAGIAASIALVTKIVGIVETIERMRRETAITPKDLDRLMLNMGLVVRQHVADGEVCDRISKGWLELRV